MGVGACPAPADLGIRSAQKH